MGGARKPNECLAPARADGPPESGGLARSCPSPTPCGVSFHARSHVECIRQPMLPVTSHTGTFRRSLSKTTSHVGTFRWSLSKTTSYAGTFRRPLSKTTSHAGTFRWSLSKTTSHVGTFRRSLSKTTSHAGTFRWWLSGVETAKQHSFGRCQGGKSECRRQNHVPGWRGHRMVSSAAAGRITLSHPHWWLSTRFAGQAQRRPWRGVLSLKRATLGSSAGERGLEARRRSGGFRAGSARRL